MAGLFCSDLPNKMIAGRPGVGEGAVKILVHNISQKLHVNNRTTFSALYYRQSDQEGSQGEPGQQRQPERGRPGILPT